MDLAVQEGTVSGKAQERQGSIDGPSGLKDGEILKNMLPGSIFYARVTFTGIGVSNRVKGRNRTSGPGVKTDRMYAGYS